MKFHWLNSGACVAGLLLAIGGAHAPAMAQGAVGEDATTVEELVVSARKREESLLKAPVSATVLPEQFIQDVGGLTDPLQLAEYIVGISADSDGNPEFFIRGGGTGRNPFTESSSSQLRNGAETTGGFGGRAFSRMDLFDVRQIETYRGAQGSLYGRSAISGVINVINKAPVDDTTYNLLASYNDGPKERRLEGIYNTPLVAGRLLGRFGLALSDEQGFYNNLFNDRPLLDQQFIGGRIALKAFVTEAIDATLFLDGTNNRYYHYSIAKRRTLPGIVINTGAGSRDVNGALLPPTFRFPTPDGDVFNQAMDSPGYVTQELFNGNLTVNADVPLGVLTSVTAARYLDQRSNFDIDQSFIGGRVGAAASLCSGQFSAAAYAADANPNDDFVSISAFLTPANVVDTKCENSYDHQTKIFSQEFRLVSTGDGPLSWLVGVDYRYLGNPLIETISGRNPAAGLATGVLGVQNFVTDSEITQDSAGLFASANYKITPELLLSVSGRFSYDRKTLVLATTDRDVYRGRIGTGATLRIVRNPNFGKVFIRSDREDDYTFFDPSVTLSYDMGDHFLYGSIATGHRTGGFNRFPGVRTDPATGVVNLPVPTEFGSETAVSYEIGSKGKLNFWSVNLNYAIDVFKTEYSDLLENRSVFGGPEDVSTGGNDFLANASATINIGDAYVRGVELDFNGRVRDLPIGGWLGYQGGATYLESKITSGEDKGTRASFVPRWTIKGSLTYRRPITRTLGIVANTNHSYEEGAREQSGGRFKPINITSARLGFEGRQRNGDAWSLVAFANNLFDVTYQISRSAVPTGFPSETINTPFSLGVRLTLGGTLKD